MPEYENLRRRADDVDQRIRALRNQDVWDLRNLADLEKAVEEAVDPDIAYRRRPRPPGTPRSELPRPRQPPLRRRRRTTGRPSTHLAADVARREQMKYIVTLNSDELDKAVRRDFDPTGRLLEQRLTDAYESGGPFGFRF